MPDGHGRCQMCGPRAPASCPLYHPGHLRHAVQVAACPGSGRMTAPHLHLPGAAGAPCYPAATPRPMLRPQVPCMVLQAASSYHGICQQLMTPAASARHPRPESLNHQSGRRATAQPAPAASEQRPAQSRRRSHHPRRRLAPAPHPVRHGNTHISAPFILVKALRMPPPQAGIVNVHAARRHRRQQQTSSAAACSRSARSSLDSLGSRAVLFRRSALSACSRCARCTAWQIFLSAAFKAHASLCMCVAAHATCNMRCMQHKPQSCTFGTSAVVIFAARPGSPPATERGPRARRGA